MGGIRVPVYIVCAALAVAVKSDDAASNYYGRRLEAVDVVPDRETISYLLPRLTAKYRPNSEWSGVTDPRFYVLTETDSGNGDDIDSQVPYSTETRSKRAGLNTSPSLSIVNSLDVLRNRLLLEIARKKAMEGANRNRLILSNLGKRALYNKRNAVRYDNGV